MVQKLLSVDESKNPSIGQTQSTLVTGESPEIKKVSLKMNELQLNLF